MMDNQSRRRRRRQGGNFFVEMGLGFLPFFALLFGIMDFSLAIFISNTLQNAVREGSRYAITYNVTYQGTTYSSQTDAVKAVVESFSMGFLNDSNKGYINVNYYLPNDLSTPATTSSVTPPVTVNGVLISYLNQTGNVVEVQVKQFPWNWMVPLGGWGGGVGPGAMPGKGITMSAVASDVLQSYPVGAADPTKPPVNP
jgi:Flp pilus assembly protein TadG